MKQSIRIKEVVETGKLPGGVRGFVSAAIEPAGIIVRGIAVRHRLKRWTIELPRAGIGHQGHGAVIVLPPDLHEQLTRDACRAVRLHEAVA